MEGKKVELNQQSEAVFLAVTNDQKTYKAMVVHLTTYKSAGSWVALRKMMKRDINSYCDKECSSIRLMSGDGYCWMRGNDNTNLDHLVNYLLHYYSEEVFGYHFEQWCGIDNPPPSSKEAYQDNATKYAAKPIKKEPETMKSIEIIKKTLINGTDITTMSDNDLFTKIAQAEAEVKALEEIEAKPKKLVARITEIKKSITDLVKLMDSTK